MWEMRQRQPDTREKGALEDGSGPVSGWKENTVKKARAFAGGELEEEARSREMQGKGIPSLEQGHRGLRTRRAQGDLPL